MLAFALQLGAGAHVVGHVGDVHPDFPMAVLQLLDAQGVVEVLGVGRVDGEGGDVAEVAATGNFVLRDNLADALRFGLHFLGEFKGQTELSHDGVNLRLVATGSPEVADNLAHRLAAAVLRKLGDAHQHLVAVARLVQQVRRHKHVEVHLAVVWFNKTQGALNLDAAHHFGALALEHFHHVAHRAAVTGAAHPHPHHVALQGKLELVREHANVVRIAGTLGHHEGEVGRGQIHGADDGVRRRALGAVVAVHVVETGGPTAVHNGVLAKLGLH